MSKRNRKGWPREPIITVHMEITDQAAFLWTGEKEGQVEHLEVVPRPKGPDRKPTT